MRCVVSPLLCRFAGDSKRIGVGTSRLAQVLDTAIARLGTNMPVHPYLDQKKFSEVESEMRQLSPHLKAAACVFRSRIAFVDGVFVVFVCVFIQELIATPEQRKRARKSQTGYEDILSRATGPRKDRGRVEASARYVHAWLKKPVSPLRNLLAALSDGGSFFCASTHTRAGAGAVAFRAAQDEGSQMGILEEEFVRGCLVHHCDGA